ncbi:MAG: riboflavin synthase [Pelagibacteraceae bacterium]|jgi:riboflavin synthase|nr:riboflavin synthase [Pelagibacteraceae bacterium]HJL58453.1 riboflavin synthase [Alphaproteobacteria bacterium]MBO6466332.1 riboflavin synthase [Pelagibacteraceae bacterium]MBO6468238.1 riboflavin synthase [Pelagibacteraceae bacterium]MBO6469516.1 riboflavin synthase [Pelagibacteraceae bacterium]|tara:strand:+ start:536 stop:1132 length:597 start_codon:yes stop_codon:yes gene_type:complete
MFTGIIQDQAIIKNKTSNFSEITFETNLNLSDCKTGSSINCDGICLTATSINFENNKYLFTVNISEETLKRSTTKFWNNNYKINLEKSIKAGDEIAGHFVYGHVDCVTKILKINELESSWEFVFQKDNSNKNMERSIVQKGSIAVNGISLTVANLLSDNFSISIIPHTYENTNLNNAKVNDLVNIEFDALSRYVLKNE